LARWIVLAIIFCSVAVLGYYYKNGDTAQKVWDEWASTPRPVWSYGQGNYSVLGFNPAIDAFLGDPFFLPRFAEDASEHLSPNLVNSVAAAWRYSAFGGGVIPGCPELAPPKEWEIALGDAAASAYSAWKCFLDIRKEVISIFSALDKSEKKYILEKYSQFFFNPKTPDAYDIFTTESLTSFIFYTLSRKIDIKALAFQERRLANIAEYLSKHKAEYEKLPATLHFLFEEEGAKMLIAGTGNDKHSEDVDFLIDAGGNDDYLNNAGGTGKHFPVALLVDFSGDDNYKGKVAAQGAGVLGLGLLADLSGDDSYDAVELSQGAAFFGSGILWDESGNDSYKLDWFGQGASAFGAAMLFDKGGNDTYTALGFAQAASTTSGAAWLVDLEGDDRYLLGEVEKDKLKKNMGIGQGASVGVRFNPFNATPSLYGGLSFLYDAKGNDLYKGNWFSQGSAYFLGAGILVDDAGDDVYQAKVNSQGQGLHLAAGLLLDKKGNDTYQAEWGSQGVGGDMSIGVLIDGEGNDNYYVLEQGIGTARKPQALGLFLDGCCDNKYFFKTGNANIVLPESPEEWPSALFIDAGGKDVFPAFRKEDHWGVEGHSQGIKGSGQIKEDWLSSLPRYPRVEGLAYDPEKGWLETGAISPINVSFLPSMLATSLISARNKLEILDIIRFTHYFNSPLLKQFPEHLISVLRDPSLYYSPVLIYALQYFYNSQDNTAVKSVSKDLESKSLIEPIMRRYALLYLASTDSTQALSFAKKLYQEDDALYVKIIAIFILALSPDKDNMPLIQNALESDQELIRYSVLNGLSVSKPQGWQVWIRPLLNDPNEYVRKQATLLLEGNTK
jgi:hypothetical protein